jgi:hypothetical protein
MISTEHAHPIVQAFSRPGNVIPETKIDRLYACPACQRVCQIELPRHDTRLTRGKKRRMLLQSRCCNVKLKSLICGCGKPFHTLGALRMHQRENHSPGNEASR